jgi:hypothetical protein
VIFKEEQILYDAALTKLSAMWIGMYVTGSFLDQIKVQFGIEQMIENDVMT